MGDVKCPKCQTANPSDSKSCKEGATPLPPVKAVSDSPTETLQAAIRELTTGSTFAGRYQVIEELGKGGMGRVYKVFDTKIKERVALKLIKPEVASDRETIERFSNELKFARKMQVAEEIGAKGIEGQVYLNLSRLHESGGRKDQARDSFSRAVRIFEECGYDGYIKQTKEALEAG